METSGKPQLSQASEAIETRTGCIGRERELERIEALYAEAVAARAGRVVLVSGQAGIGKTRLLDEARRRLQAQNVLVLEGRCREPSAGAPPYAPIAEIVEAALRALGEDPTGARAP